MKQHCLAVCIDGPKDRPRVDKRGVDATVFPYLDMIRKSLACTVSKLIDGVQEKRGRVRRFTDCPSFGVSSVRVNFSSLFKLVSLNYLGN